MGLLLLAGSYSLFLLPGIFITASDTFISQQTMVDARSYLAVAYSLRFNSLWGENNFEILTQNKKCVATVSPAWARRLVTNILPPHQLLGKAISSLIFNWNTMRSDRVCTRSWQRIRQSSKVTLQIVSNVPPVPINKVSSVSNSNLLSIYSTASRLGRPSHNSDEILLTELLIRLYRAKTSPDAAFIGILLSGSPEQVYSTSCKQSQSEGCVYHLSINQVLHFQTEK